MSVAALIAAMLMGGSLARTRQTMASGYATGVRDQDQSPIRIAMVSGMPY
jgi:cellobiose phosphorylase